MYSYPYENAYMHDREFPSFNSRALAASVDRSRMRSIRSRQESKTMINLPKDNGTLATLGLVGALAAAGLGAGLSTYGSAASSDYDQNSNELYLWMVNTGDFYRSKTVPALKRLAKAMANGRYDSKWPSIYENLIGRAVMPWRREMRKMGHGKARLLVNTQMIAGELEEHYRSSVEELSSMGSRALHTKGSLARRPSMLRWRIELANRYIDWAMTNDVTGFGYFGSTYPSVIKYTHPIKLTHNETRATVRYSDQSNKHKEVYVLNDNERVRDLRYEISNYIIKAIKNGAKRDDLKVPNFK